MKLKSLLRNHNFQEGIFFLLVSGGLMGYSLDSYNNSFNKAWSQSPSLFPLMISLLVAVFAIILIVQGVRERCAPDSPIKGQIVPVLVVLGLTLLYYLALSKIKLPYMAVNVSVTTLTASASTFSLILTLSTFEVATFVFLLVLMFYLGVRSKPVLIAVPLGTTVFLSIIFRSMLHVLLP